MNETRPASRWRLWLILFSLLLISAAITRWIETDGGSVLIHNIPVEVDEFNYIPGRIYRPIEASSLDRKPAILISNAFSPNLNLTSPLAISLAKRGFVVLAVSSQFVSVSETSDKMDLVPSLEAAEQLLLSQPFVDQEKTGLLGIDIKRKDEINSSFNVNKKISSPGIEIVQAAESLIKNLKPQDQVNISDWLVILREVLLAGNFLLAMWLFSGKLSLIIYRKPIGDNLPGSYISQKRGFGELFLALLTLMVFYGFIWVMTQLFMIEFRFFQIALQPLDSNVWKRFLIWLIPALALFLSIENLASITKKRRILIGLVLLAGIIALGLLYYNHYEIVSTSALLSEYPEPLYVTGLNLLSFRMIWQGLPLTFLFFFLSWLMKQSHKTTRNKRAYQFFYSTIFAWILASSGF